MTDQVTRRTSIGKIVAVVFSLLFIAAALAFIGATTGGFIKPLIVDTGSMDPAIPAGSIVIDTKLPVEELEVGDVVTLWSEITERYVTHRIVGIDRTPEGVHLLTKGDANEDRDADRHLVEGAAWSPWTHFAGPGLALIAAASPSVWVPGLAALVMLIGAAWLLTVFLKLRREQAVGVAFSKPIDS